MIFLDIAKLALYGIFLNYYCYYTIKGSFIPRGTVIFFAVAFICVLVSVLNDRLVYVGYEIRCWMLYACLSFVTVEFAMNSGYAVNSLAKYVQRLIIIMMVAYICEKEKSIGFALRLLTVSSVACAVSVLYTVDDIQQKLSISSAAELSANDVGALMAFGCFAVLFAFGRKKQYSTLTRALKIVFLIMLITIIFLAGSRKSIYAVVIFFVLLVLLCGKDYVKRLPLSQIVMIIILGAIAFSFVNQYLAPHMEETNLYVRLFGRGAEAAAASDEGRWELYVLAIKDFFHHPIVGLGFDNFTLAHGNYTHSTYVESLACSGIIGFLYLVPYIRMVRGQIYLIQENGTDNEECLWQKELFAFLIAFLFVGVGIPYMYKDVPCIVLGMFIASQKISRDKLYRRREND